MNKTIKSFTIVTVFSVVTRLLSFLFKIWMSRSLGAETVGLYQISMSVLLLLFTLTAGAPTVLSRKIAAAVADGDVKRENALTTASITLGLGVSAVLVVLFYSLSSHLGFLFADDRCLNIFLIMLPTLITSTLYANIRSWFWGHKRFLSFSSTELLDEIFKIVMSVAFVNGLAGSLFLGANGIALAVTVADLMCVVILFIMFLKAGGRFSKPRGYKEIVSATVPLSATRIISSLSASLTALIIPERLIAGGMTAAQATAQYGRVAGMAIPLIMAPIAIVSALSVVLIPDVAELAAKGSLDEVKQKLKNALTFAMLSASVFFVIYLPLGRQIGFLLFGDREAGVFVSYCSLLLFPMALMQVTTPMLNSLGMEKHTFFNSLTGALTVLPCIFFLPQVIGVYAMAVGSGMCFLTTSVLNLVCLAKKLGKLDGMGKAVIIVAFSIPLGALGLLSERLMSAVCGEIVTTIVISVYIVFFLGVFINAFDIIDIAGYVALLKPDSGFVKAFSSRRRLRQNKRRTVCKAKRNAARTCKKTQTFRA